MIEELYRVDVWLFTLVNRDMANAVFDAVMPIITTTKYWLPIYVVGIAALLWQGFRHRASIDGRRMLWCAALLLAVVVVLDKASHAFLKEVIDRPRPYLVLPDVRQLVGSGGGSFPSNHAMNNAAAAVIIGVLYPRWRWLAASIALIMGLSRVYVGVHYPSDVLGGFVIGATAGLGFVMIARRWLR